MWLNVLMTVSLSAKAKQSLKGPRGKFLKRRIERSILKRRPVLAFNNTSLVISF